MMKKIRLRIPYSHPWSTWRLEIHEKGPTHPVCAVQLILVKLEHAIVQTVGHGVFRDVVVVAIPPLCAYFCHLHQLSKIHLDILSYVAISGIPAPISSLCVQAPVVRKTVGGVFWRGAEGWIGDLSVLHSKRSITICKYEPGTVNGVTRAGLASCDQLPNIFFPFLFLLDFWLPRSRFAKTNKKKKKNSRPPNEE